MGAGVLVPITALLSIAAAIVSFFYYRHRTRAEYQQTVRAAIDKGQPITPEFLERLGERHLGRDRSRDLRFGILALAIGIAIASFGFILGEEEAIRPLRGVGNLPILVGLAMLALWRFAPRE
jgi:hypothetical protein